MYSAIPYFCNLRLSFFQCEKCTWLLSGFSISNVGRTTDCLSQQAMVKSEIFMQATVLASNLIRSARISSAAILRLKQLPRSARHHASLNNIHPLCVIISFVKREREREKKKNIKLKKDLLGGGINLKHICSLSSLEKRWDTSTINEPGVCGGFL